MVAGADDFFPQPGWIDVDAPFFDFQPADFPLAAVRSQLLAVERQHIDDFERSERGVGDQRGRS